MREIKFRGKRVYNGEWVYGSYVPSFGGKHFIITPYSHVKELWDYYEVDPSTVGQYTGLKDKDGKDVYEGDKNIYGEAIMFNEEKALYAFHYYSKILKSWRVSSYPVMARDIIIIGNIHEIS